MTRALKVTALLALGLLVASSYAAAQDAPAKTSGGQVTITGLGRDDVSSAKFQEYREVPKGISMPYVNLFTKNDKVDFNLQGSNVSQTDQRYFGWFNTKAFGLKFDYNQIPHNMGNNGQTFLSETAPGVWSMSDTLQQSIQTGNDAAPTANRTVTFYDALLGPTFAATNSIDISSVRKRGTGEINFNDKLPFDLAFSYMRELKSGYRGDDGGGIYSAVNSVVEVPGPLNELNQDFGVKAAYNFAKGNVHGAFNRNLYNNNAESLTVDNPFQGTTRCTSRRRPRPSVAAAARGGSRRPTTKPAPSTPASC